MEHSDIYLGIIKLCWVSDDIIFRYHYEKQEILCFSLALKITENKPD